MSKQLPEQVLELFQRPPRWRFINEPLAVDPLQALERDTFLLKEVASGKRGATARLWENPQCLVVTRKETRFPSFSEAREQLPKEGWPVIVRESGGTTVPHHPGILNFSLIFPQYPAIHFDLDSVYMALCEPIRLALKALNLDAEYGETKGSYCDGRYNLNVRGLKITGTAQKIMVSPPNEKGIKQAVLAQAMLMVDADAAEGTHWVNRFYELAGNERRFDPDVSTSIKDLIELSDSDTDMTLMMRDLLHQAFIQLTR